MVSLSVGKDFVILTFIDSSVVFYKKNNSYEEQLLLNHVSTTTKEELDQTDGNISVCASVSAGCEYFTCCIHKDLYLWKTKDWSLLSKRVINRSVSAIVFSPRNDNVIIADKSGDAFLYSVDNPNKEGELILGHISMLLDVLITPNSKYIVTCDRDEKIRVSYYPNAYNIQSYCLAHEEFVTTVTILAHDESVLVSASGDGTIRFWDYVAGEQLLCYSCKDFHIDDNNENNKPVITKIVSMKCVEQESMLCVQCFTFKGLLIYSVSSDNNNKLNCVLMQTITLDAEPWCLNISENHIWILKQNVEESVSVYVHSKDKNEFLLDNNLNYLKSLIKKHIPLLENVFKLERHLTTLYKRRFDNVQDYLKRKMMRIESETSKSKKQLSNSELSS